MKNLLFSFLMFSSFYGWGQIIPEPDIDFSWQEDKNFWTGIYNKPEKQKCYQGKNPESIIFQAMEYAQENGVDPNNPQAFLKDLSEDITDNLLDSFEEEVLERLMQEIGIANYLDEVYQKLLKSSLPKGEGIPVIDVGMGPSIKKGNTQHNLKVMVKMAVERWLTQEWEKQVKAIYGIQREDLEYRKRVGIVGLLQMADLEYEHFLSLEIMLPEQLLNYAHQLRQIYLSVDESLAKGNRLYNEFNITATDLEIPEKIETLYLLKEGSEKAKTSSWELINQRRKALAMAYLQMAERAQKKAVDLQQTIKTDAYLKMSDGDRLKAQQIVNSYMADSFHYKEKADLLLQASLQNRGVSKKEVQLTKYYQSLRLKNLRQ